MPGGSPEQDPPGHVACPGLPPGRPRQGHVACPGAPPGQAAPRTRGVPGALPGHAATSYPWLARACCAADTWHARAPPGMPRPAALGLTEQAALMTRGVPAPPGTPFQGPLMPGVSGSRRRHHHDPVGRSGSPSPEARWAREGSRSRGVRFDLSSLTVRRCRGSQQRGSRSCSSGEGSLSLRRPRTGGGPS